MVEVYGNLKHRDYIVNFYRFKRLRDHILVVNDYGGWALLTKKEFDLLRSYRVHENAHLYHILKERGIIITEDSMDHVVNQTRKKLGFLFHGPTLHIIIPTFRCNMRCVYCHSFAKPLDAKGYDLDKKTAKKIADRILSTPVDSLTVEFQGGDCSLNIDVVEFLISYLLEHKGDRDIRFCLVTNLTSVEDNILERFTSLLYKPEHGLININTSLDGPKELHDQNRRYLNGKGTYDDVVGKIRHIKEDFKYRFTFGALTTITKQSFKFKNAIVDEFVDLDLDTIFIRPLNRLGFAEKTWSRIGYSIEEFCDFWLDQLNYILKVNGNYKIQEGWAKIISSKILRDVHVSFVDLSAPCGAAIQQVVYNHKGKIFTCDEAKVSREFKIGNVDDIPRFNKTALNLVDVSSLYSLVCDACVWRPFCGTCPVMNYFQYGDIIPVIPENEKHKLFMFMIQTMFEKILFSDKARKIIEGWQYRE